MTVFGRDLVEQILQKYRNWDILSVEKESFFMWIKQIKDYILYEDKNILVCHKPAGIAVQNARVGSMDLESLLKNYLAQKNPGKMPYLGIINRLDQPVEGALVFALDPRSAAELNRQMTNGQIEKVYLAVTAAKAAQRSAVLEDWLKKENRTNSSAVVPAGTPGAKKAVLSYEVIDEDLETDDKTYTLLRIRLETGRHHQIRVQMAHAQMPLLGDRKYNPTEECRIPLALCSAELGFLHPATKKPMHFRVAPAGEGFQRFFADPKVKKVLNLWTKS